MDAPAYDYGRLLMRLGITAREAAPAAAGASPTLQTLKRRLLMLHDASPHARAPLAALVGARRDRRHARHPDAPHRAQHGASSHPTLRSTARTCRNGAQTSATGPTCPTTTRDGESWVFLQDDENSAMHGSSLDLVEAKRLRANASEPLIWFKRDGRAYVIRDRETLDKARALFIPQEKLQQDDARARGASDDPSRAADRAGPAHRRRCANRCATSTEKVDEAAAAVQKTIAPPTRPTEERGESGGGNPPARDRLREAEARRREATAHQEALGAQQRALGEQQAALGEEQAALGRQLEELRRAMEREMRMLLDNALAAGVATPVK